MTEAMIEEPQATEWVEMETKQPAAAANPPRPPIRIWGPRPDAERAPGGCRCWRCSGAYVASSEKSAMDRILAKHYVRMSRTSKAEADEWLRQWAATPNHSPEDLRTLETWIRIEAGEKVAEPKYFARMF